MAMFKPVARVHKSMTSRLHQEAYLKSVLHACKYTTRFVCGIFLGKKNEGVLDIVDAVPLFHSTILAPMTEVALIQVT